MPFWQRIPVLAVLMALGATAMPVSASWPADFDGDSDVDLADFGVFAACFNGPNRPTLPGCTANTDLDGDNDVDLADFGLFAVAFNGPNRLPMCSLTVEIPGGNGACVPMSGRYPANTVVDLLAQPVDGYQVKYQLKSWSGTDNDSLTTNENAVTMTDNKTVTLVFEIDIAPPSGMVLIPAGEFQMGDSFDEGHSDGRELPVHAVYVDAFHMDRTEVTNQQYADALNWALAQGDQITMTWHQVCKYNTGIEYCDTTDSSSRSWITWDGNAFGVVSGKEYHPMVEVSWCGSVAYANWRSAMEGLTPCYDLSTWECNFSANGYRLPTEAEWERAARGGTAGRRFPWSDSDTIQHARANYYSYWFAGAPTRPYDTSPTQGWHPTFNIGGTPGSSPVAYFAPNDYGLYDMAANAQEWCNDWYSKTYYSSSPYNNPRGPTSGTYRVRRSGGWCIGAWDCRVACRCSGYPDAGHYYSGFRCVAGSP